MYISVYLLPPAGVIYLQRYRISFPAYISIHSASVWCQSQHAQREHPSQIICSLCRANYLVQSLSHTCSQLKVSSLPDLHVKSYRNLTGIKPGDLTHQIFRLHNTLSILMHRISIWLTSLLMIYCVNQIKYEGRDYICRVLCRMIMLDLFLIRVIILCKLILHHDG